MTEPNLTVRTVRANTKLARRSLLAGIGITAAAGATPPSAPQHPDAHLIELCSRHIANLRANNAAGIDHENNPFWDAYVRSMDAVSAAKPKTLEGAFAKAQAAIVESTNPDGSVDHHGSELGAQWAWDVMNDILRLSGRA